MGQVEPKEEWSKWQCGQGLEPLKEKLLLGLIWDKSELGHKQELQREPVEELVPVQVHLTNPTKPAV